MKILVINSGSSSLKYQLVDMRDETILAKGICERIGTEDGHFKHLTYDKRKIDEKLIMKDHKQALLHVKDILTDKNFGVINNLNELSAVGHRVVQGGKYFNKSVFINDYVIDKIKELIPLAPLHNEANLNVILACREMLGEDLTQVAVFDTAFHASMPPKAYMFAIPYEYYEKYNIRKYGFHGISHKYVSERCASLMDRKFKDLKIITCHIGNGSSITAINKGEVLDTSMGLTPLDGLMMGTRCGSIDPSVVTFLAEKEGLSFDEVNRMLNKKSGLLGISGISNDERDIMREAKKGNKRAILAHEMLTYQITKFIGSYFAVMQGCDAIVFTAGIGENQWIHRKVICENLGFLGVKLSKELNRSTFGGKEGKISSNDSSVDVYVIPTNEEIVIARDTKCILESFNKRD